MSHEKAKVLKQLYCPMAKTYDGGILRHIRRQHGAKGYRRERLVAYSRPRMTIVT